MENKYVQVYLSFLRQQIPPIFQIITFPAIVAFLLPQNFAQFFTLLLVSLLTFVYLQEKFRYFLVEQIRDKFSAINLGEVNDQELVKRGRVYMLFTCIAIFVVLMALSDRLTF